MLEIKTAKLIKKAINERCAPFGKVIKLEDICRMQPIPLSAKDNGYTILGLQYGNVTILVWLQVTATDGVCVRDIKTQLW